MASFKETKARIKINKLLKRAGWRFFDDERGEANIQLKPNANLTQKDMDVFGEDFESTEGGFIDFLLLNEKGSPFVVLEVKKEEKDPLDGKEQARRYAQSQNARFVLLSNGNLHYFWDLERGNPEIITEFPTQESLLHRLEFTSDNKRLADLQVLSPSNQTAHNNLELEIKFLLSEMEAKRLRETIVKLPGGFDAGRVYEKTTMLDNTAGEMQKVDARLRLREIKKKKENAFADIEFSYKRRLQADGGIKKEEEIGTSFNTDINQFFSIMKKMGYEVTTSYERYRETFKASDTKITLDEFPFGYVLEVEGEEELIRPVCEELNLDPAKSYPLSCDDAYADLCEKKGIRPKNHILFDDPEMPHLD